MNHGTADSQPRFFVSADWSKDPRKRSVYVADLSERLIYREARSGWALPSLMALARQLSKQGSVLVGVDLVLGVPQSYWKLVLAESRYGQPATFIDCLSGLGDNGGFFDPSKRVYDHREWRVERPWFHVPRGPGGLTSFKEKADDGFLRRIDHATGAKPLFVVSGIPGTVGSGTRDFWRELSTCLASDRDFVVWPFDGRLAELLRTNRIVLAETYPGLAYGAALASDLPTERFAIGKTKPEERNRACDLLAEAAWIDAHGVRLGELAPARDDEDDFDAHLTAAAVLRCYLDGTPVVDEEWVDPIAEGSMLLAGPVDPNRRSKALSAPGSRSAQAGLHLQAPVATTRKQRIRQSPQPAPRQKTDYSCPIPGCTKVFHGSRGGWDAHVASPRKHPGWYADVKSPQVRKELFKRDFGNWFR
ncbi:MAG: hypothetical protein OXG74_03685 [Acidobacteria bacterium]|nr:hypothetical protein [Acidobacteriota bacterium]